MGEATREDPCDLLNIRDASEVALAYLYRGLEAGRPLPETANLGRAVAAVAGTAPSLGRLVRADALERRDEVVRRLQGPDAVVSLLDTLAEDDAFRRRFLPARSPTPAC